MSSRRSVLAPLAFACPAVLGALGTAFIGSPAPGVVSGSALRGTVSGVTLNNDAPSFGSSSTTSYPVASLMVAAAAAVACKAAKKKDMGPSGEEIAKTIPRPEDLLSDPRFPLTQGSTGGYFSRWTKERHAITWTSPEPQLFEMPTGPFSWALMNKGENLCYFRKKEQCIALGKQLRKMKIENYKVFRISKDGTVKFMHPADGVFPDKVNKGRVPTNFRPFSCGSNANQANFKWTKYNQKTFEADALSTMFVKARLEAFSDRENLFPLPQPNVFAKRDFDSEEQFKQYQEDLMEAIDKTELPPPRKSM